jgi:hypothetical protein
MTVNIGDLLEAEKGVRESILLMNRAVDDEDWKTVRQYLSNDFHLERATPPGIHGPNAMITMMKDHAARTSGTRSQHILGNMIITVEGDEAEASALQKMYRYRSGECSNPLSKSASRVVSAAKGAQELDDCILLFCQTMDGGRVVLSQDIAKQLGFPARPGADSISPYSLRRQPECFAR